MSRELQDRADIIEKELREMLQPISYEIKRIKQTTGDSQIDRHINSKHWSI